MGARVVAVLGIWASGRAEPATDASIRELMEVTRAREVLEQTRETTEKQLAESFQKSSRSPQGAEHITQEAHEKLRALVREELSWEKLEPVQLRIYRDSLTEEEVQGMIAFYRTPAGQALAKKMPVVAQNSMNEVQGKMRSVMQKAMAIARESVAQLKDELEKKAPKPEKLEASPGEICLKTLPRTVFPSAKALAAARAAGELAPKIEGMDCRYFVRAEHVARLPALNPRTGENLLPPHEALAKAYAGYFAKQAIREDEFYRMAELALQKADDFTRATGAQALREQPGAVREAWFYLVKCDWPVAAKQETLPSPVLVLMDGELVIAKEEKRALPATGTTPRATPAMKPATVRPRASETAAAEPAAGAGTEASAARDPERPASTLEPSPDAKDRGKDLRERLALGARLARLELPPHVIEDIVAPGLKTRLEKIESLPEHEEAVKATRDAVRRLADKLVATRTLWDQVAQRYATHFTLDELEELVKATSTAAMQKRERLRADLMGLMGVAISEGAGAEMRALQKAVAELPRPPGAPSRASASPRTTAPPTRDELRPKL